MLDALDRPGSGLRHWSADQGIGPAWWFAMRWLAMRWPTLVASRVGVAMTMVDLPDQRDDRLVRRLGHSSGLERLELCHEKYKEGCYDRWD